MSDHNRRLNKLENDAGDGDELPWLTVKQDFDDKDLYRDKAGNEYSESQFDELRESYQLIIIEYGPWPPGKQEPEPGVTQLRWPEDD
jgi:hypothetical protein